MSLLCLLPAGTSTRDSVHCFCAPRLPPLSSFSPPVVGISRALRLTTVPLVSSLFLFGSFLSFVPLILSVCAFPCLVYLRFLSYYRLYFHLPSYTCFYHSLSRHYLLQHPRKNFPLPGSPVSCRGLDGRRRDGIPAERRV